MIKRIAILGALLLALIATADARNPRGVASGSGGGGSPVLTPGVWTNITPPVNTSPLSFWFGISSFAIDPSHPLTIYVSVDQLGMWKTTNGGSTWVQLGTQPGTGGCVTTTYLDSPVEVAVDPNDSTHIIATQGVRGTTLGFWVSHDSGNTWTLPAGFCTISVTTTNDVTTLAVDPTDFNHILLGSHGSWASSPSTPGILESTDGGATWTAHAGVSGWPNGSLALGFAYDPPNGQGNSCTWVIGTDGDGQWRTTNCGTSFTQTSALGDAHGGAQFNYTPAGVLYAGSTPYPIRSTDNGVTWTQVGTTTLSGFYYYGVWNDGHTLYAQLSFANQGSSGAPASAYWVSPLSDGVNYTAYQGGAQTFANGPFSMHYDSTNCIMYSANWTVGFWALKPLVCP